MVIRRTAIVVGPGGIGKSPLDSLFQVDARIDPYRLRSDGPRDSGDVLYAPPRLRDELLSVLATLGDRVLQIGRPGQPIEWFPRAKVLFFKVRDDWQCVILNGLEGQTAKAEIYAPTLPMLLSAPGISDLLGKTEIILLNPAPQSVAAMQDWKRLERETQHNCTGRGDSFKSVGDRVRSIAREAPAWKRLIQEYAATEYCAWEFPEYLYKRPPPGVGVVEHQVRTLIQARSRLLEGNPGLGVFFKSEDEIKQMDGILVKIKKPGNVGQRLAEFIKLLREETLHHKDKRATFVLQKLAFTVALFGLGTIQTANLGAAELQIPELLLYALPFVAISYDVYIYAEDYKVKRIGKFFLLSKHRSPYEEEWEEYVTSLREPLAVWASLVLTLITIFPACITFYSKCSGSFSDVLLLPSFSVFVVWLFIVLLLTFSVFVYYRRRLWRLWRI